MNKLEAEKHRKHGIQIAKKLGIYRNAKLKFTKYNKNLQRAFYEVCHRSINKMSYQAIADTNHMSRSTLINKVKKYKPQPKQTDFYNDTNTRSFSNWIGGKARTYILQKLINLVPNNYNPNKNTMMEAFSGMASLSFAIKPSHLILNDTNPLVINAFKVVRQKPLQLIIQLRKRLKSNTRKYFYHVRNNINKNKYNAIEKASALLFMIDTSFNSFIRFNQQGKLNTSYGIGRVRAISPKIILNDSKYLNSINLKLMNMDFEKAIKQINLKKHDFVYFDPPFSYGFKRYGSHIFNINDLIKLRNICILLSFKHVYCMISNYDTKTVRSIFMGQPFHIHNFKNAQAINSNGKSRKRKYRELIITNY